MNLFLQIVVVRNGTKLYVHLLHLKRGTKLKFLSGAATAFSCVPMIFTCHYKSAPHSWHGDNWSHAAPAALLLGAVWQIMVSKTSTDLRLEQLRVCLMTWPRNNSSPPAETMMTEWRFILPATARFTLLRRKQKKKGTSFCCSITSTPWCKTQQLCISLDLQHELMSSAALHSTVGRSKQPERDVQIRVISPDNVLDKGKHMESYRGC